MTLDRFLSRRRVLETGVLTTACGLLMQAGRPRPLLAATPACHDEAEATMAQTEGPFFKPQSPRRNDLREPSMEGRPVDLGGVVLTRSCQPIAGALVDLWHADDKGHYDNRGFRYRGHLFTDAQGRYEFHTIVPGLYPGRTRHYQVKVQAPGSSILTTQFYFPDEKQNRVDPLFRRELLMQLESREKVLQARFNVVLALS